MTNLNDELNRLIARNTANKPEEEPEKIHPYEVVKRHYKTFASWYVSDCILPAIRDNENAVRGSKIQLKQPGYALGERVYRFARDNYGIRLYSGGKGDDGWGEYRAPQETFYMNSVSCSPFDKYNKLFIDEVNRLLAASSCEVIIEEEYRNECSDYVPYLHIK